MAAPLKLPPIPDPGSDSSSQFQTLLALKHTVDRIVLELTGASAAGVIDKAVNPTDITNSTTVGRSIITALDASAARGALGATAKGVELFTAADAAAARTAISAPSTTGGGASGSWNIDITGNAGGSAKKLEDSPGSAPHFACRAWVKFDGTSNSANVSGTYSQSGTTVTGTITDHGLSVGDQFYVDITSGTGVDGLYTVATVPSANTFTYTAGSSLTTSGNVTLRRCPVNGSGNVAWVSDNGTGDYTIKFTTPMPDANYAAIANYTKTNTLTGSSNDGQAICWSHAASSLRVLVVNGAAGQEDPVICSVSVFC